MTRAVVGGMEGGGGWEGLLGCNCSLPSCNGSGVEVGGGWSRSGWWVLNLTAERRKVFLLDQVGLETNSLGNLFVEHGLWCSCLNVGNVVVGGVMSSRHRRLWCTVELW